jgi:hypothetical protein
VGTGEQLLACAKSDVEGIRKACHQDKAREWKLTEKGVDNDVILGLVDQLRKGSDYVLPASQIANSQGCGYLLASSLKRYFFVEESRNGKKTPTSYGEAANNENSDYIGKTPHLAQISITSNSLKCSPNSSRRMSFDRP